MTSIATVNQPFEWILTAEHCPADPFWKIECRFDISHEDGERWVCRAFWDGGSRWVMRFCPPKPGRYHALSRCNDTSIQGLHQVDISFHAQPYQGANIFGQHGGLAISEDGRYFTHQDGTPFFWLADTWWMGLCSRIDWDGFQQLTADRVAKGFNVVQIVAGLYPDMPPMDPRGRNEAGYPWTEGYGEINPEYFQYMDRRIQHLAQAGISPCIVGMWGYLMEQMGYEKAMAHWKYLVARYSAYPVTWCVAGEAMMPYYLHPLWNDRDQYEPPVRALHTSLARGIREIDPHQRPITSHPIYMRGARDEVDDETVLDFDMIQVGGAGWLQFHDSVAAIRQAVARRPSMPCFAAEVIYEGLGATNPPELQRLMFWSCILSGAKAHTYGANGIWQANAPGQPHGASPHGASYGGDTYLVAAQYEGSAELGRAKQMLDTLPWWQMEAHPEWIECGADLGLYVPIAAQYYRPSCAGIPRRLRVIYFHSWVQLAPLLAVVQLEPDVRYVGRYWQPSSGETIELGPITPDLQGRWPNPMAPSLRDWVLILQAE